MRTLALVALALLVAGCVQTSTHSSSTAPTNAQTTAEVVSGTGVGANAASDWGKRILSDHDGNFTAHRDWTKHTGLSTPNFIELAHDPIASSAFEGATAGEFFCGGEATTSDGKHITVINSFDTSIAFVVMDTTDPFHPKHLGDYVLDNAQTYDVDVTPDGKHVAVAADVGPNQPAPGTLAAAGAKVPIGPIHAHFRYACGVEKDLGPIDPVAQTVAAGPSTILVSIADPTSPTFEDIVPSPVIGPHSVSTAIIDGTTYISASITNLVHQASYYQFFQVQMLPTGTGKLVQLGVFDAGEAGVTATTNGHVDAEIVKHPVTGKPVVYLSDWDGGLIILDFSIPQAPTVLSSWSDGGADGGAMHSTYEVPGVHNGHHYLLAGQEFVAHPSNRPSGWVYILDDTDPSHVKEVGRWTLPYDTPQTWSTGGGLELFSTHYFRESNGTVFVAMYHGGLWAFKADWDHPETLALPKTVGAFVPDQTVPHGRKPVSGYDIAPFVLDVFPYPDNILVVYDGLSGCYVVKYDPSRDMPSPEPWPREGRTT